MKMRERIRRAIESRLMTAPQEYGLPLRKSLRGYWKLRVGDYRVVFKIEGEIVFILGIRHRKSIYEDAMGRVNKNGERGRCTLSGTLLPPWAGRSCVRRGWDPSSGIIECKPFSLSRYRL